MGRISQRIGAISESATVAITTKAKAMRAAGEDVIGFGAGEPDFPTPDYIVTAAAEACADSSMHKYSPPAGLPLLREAVAAKTLRDSKVEVEASNVLITNGGKHAVYATLATLLDPGDEVLIPSPYWVTYPPATELAGGVPVMVPTDSSTGFRATVDMLEAARTPRTKLLVFVSPSNPTGAIYSRGETEAVGRWAAEHDIWVMTDEIYEHLVYGSAEFVSLPAVVPEIRDRCVIVNGVAKTYAMTGWRVGWMVGPEDVIKGATRLQSHSTSNVNNVAQVAAHAALIGGLDAVGEMRQAFDRRRRRMYELLNDIPGVACLEPEGAFYAFPSFSDLMGRSIAGTTITSTLQLAEVVLSEAGVAFVPGEAFGAPGYARFSYALGDADLVAGIERMGRMLAQAS